MMPVQWRAMPSTWSAVVVVCACGGYKGRRITLRGYIAAVHKDEYTGYTQLWAKHNWAKYRYVGPQHQHKSTVYWR